MSAQETVTLSPEALKARKRRSLYTALALGVFVVLIFAITVSKLGENASSFSQQHGMEEALKAQREATATTAPPASDDGEEAE